MLKYIRHWLIVKIAKIWFIISNRHPQWSNSVSSKLPAFREFRRFLSRFRRFVPGLFVLGKGISLMYSRRSFLRQSGYVESVRTKRPCRADGSPIPWMNYAVISFLEERLDKTMTMFEYGSGNSTLFFAERVGRVVSVECDRSWHDYVKGLLPPNVKLLFAPKGGEEYVQVIENQGEKYDVVIVDAEDRVACMINAEKGLNDGGVILLDDSTTEEFADGIDTMLARGFRRLNFDGLKSGSVRCYRTTVFYRPGNCFGI